MYIYERMTKNAISAQPDMTVSKVYQIMKETRHSQLPVINENLEIIGLITEKTLAEINPTNSSSALKEYEINYLLSHTKIYEIMQTGVFKINKNKSIEDGALLMKENHIGFLPVTNDDNTLAGVITRFDIFKAFIEIMGIKEPGTRISILYNNNLSDFYKIIDIIRQYNLEIKNINNFNSKGKSEIIIKLSNSNVTDLIKKLENENFKIISTNQQH